MPIYNINNEIPSTFLPNDILDCPYSGSVKSLTLPTGQYRLETWGAQGGSNDDSAAGGKGGYSVGTLNLTAPTLIYLYAGGCPGIATTAGWNGGASTTRYGGGGGGASDIRIGNTSLNCRVIVAGGGGGAGFSATVGGYGGGSSGGQGGNGSTTGGYGGTQTAGGSNNIPGIFGQAQTNSGNGGGGGGGWYGGASGAGSSTDSGGGGGSGFVYTTVNNSIILSTSYLLTSANTLGGNTSFVAPNGSNEVGHSGSGYIRITIISTASPTFFILKDGNYKPYTLYEKVNNIWEKIDGENFINKIFLS